jgi:hypothetical protein
MTETKIQRSITYEYGPAGMNPPFRSKVSGFYTWDELIEHIEDDRWGSGYEIVARDEREITYGDWTAV